MVYVHLKHDKPVFHLPRVHIFLCCTSLSRLGRIIKKNHLSGELGLSIHPSSKVTNWRALWIWHKRFRYKHLACAFSKMRRVCCVCARLGLMTVLWAWFKKKKRRSGCQFEVCGWAHVLDPGDCEVFLVEWVCWFCPEAAALWQVKCEKHTNTVWVC